MDYICKTTGLIPGVSAGDIVSDDDEKVKWIVERYPGEFEQVDGGTAASPPDPLSFGAHDAPQDEGETQERR